MHKIGISTADIVRYIKAQRIRWVGHIVRRDIERAVKMITDGRQIPITRIGVLKLGWEGNVGDGLEE
jgi:hypothetical protein